MQITVSKHLLLKIIVAKCIIDLKPKQNENQKLKLQNFDRLTVACKADVRSPVKNVTKKVIILNGRTIFSFSPLLFAQRYIQAALP